MATYVCSSCNGSFSCNIDWNTSCELCGFVGEVKQVDNGTFVLGASSIDEAGRYAMSHAERQHLANHLQADRLSKSRFFLFLFVPPVIIAALGVFVAILADVAHRSVGSSLSEIAAPLSAVAGGVFFLVVWMRLLYAAWDALPQYSRRTTPGCAVGFLFIPFFTYYWQFQAYCGWCSDYSRFVASEPGRPFPPAPRMQAWLVCIVTCLCALTWFLDTTLFLVLAVGLLAIGCAFAAGLIDCINALRSWRAT